MHIFRPRHSIAVLLLAAVAACSSIPLESGMEVARVQTAAATPMPSSEIAAKIREEGLQRSQVMKTLDHLCNVIGPRLTGSPAMKRANEWTRDQMASYGLVNAHLESWGPFGKGWTLKRFSLQAIEPHAFPLNAYPKAWSPGLAGPIEAPLVYLQASSVGELEKYRGTLQGKIVLIGNTRTLPSLYQPLATRFTAEDLARAETFAAGTDLGAGRIIARGGGRGNAATQPIAGNASTSATTQPVAGGAGDAIVPAPAGRASPNGRGNAPQGRGAGAGGQQVTGRALAMAAEEGAALILEASSMGDGGIMLVQSATIPAAGGGGRGGAGAAGVGRGVEDPPATAPGAQAGGGNRAGRGGGAGGGPGGGGGPRIYALDAPKVPPQVILAMEDFNRLARMAQQGLSIRLAAELQVEFNTDDPMAYNTIAELPGTDLKEQIVMVGGHLDSWHVGTGATDNAAGCAVAMEAVRILKALNLRPRRTIRVALWSGEEQGLLGSRAYVREHFGYNPTAAGGRGGGTGGGGGGRSGVATSPATQPGRGFVKGPEFDNFSAYFNLDNGAGKIRGIFAQSNTAAAPLFREWLAPFKDLDASTVTLGNTGSTDHISFDSIGLPGFQFIQDNLDYFTRTHHTTADTFDRIPADDVKQASTVLAWLLYNAAMMEDRMPRKGSNQATP